MPVGYRNLGNSQCGATLVAITAANSGITVVKTIMITARADPFMWDVCKVAMLGDTVGDGARGVLNISAALGAILMVFVGNGLPVTTSGGIWGMVIDR